MSGFLKKYKLTLTTKSPVFIGSGDAISKREYIRCSIVGEGKEKKLFWGKQKNAEPALYIPDMAKLYAGASAEGKGAELEKYFMGRQGERHELGEWCEENSLKISRKDWGGYILTIPSDVDGTLNEIHAFVKDAYGKPYIPGSSLKGMIRTIIARSLVGGGGVGKYEKSEELNRNLFQILKDEHGGKLSAQTADFMRGIRISDSLPLELTDLTVCQKIDLRSVPNTRTGSRVNQLPMFRECLKPEVAVRFEVSVDTKLLENTGFDRYFDKINERIKKNGEKIKESSFESAILSFAEKYHEYRKKFDFENYTAARKAWVYLGGGAGFHAKTVHKPTDFQAINHILPDKMGRIMIKRNHGVAPSVLKCTYYEGKLYEMGQCAVIMEEFVK